MGIGKIGGPALGGLMGSTSIGLPFFVTVALMFLSSVAVHFLLPKSLTPEKRIKHLTLSSFNTFSHLKEIFKLKKVKYLLLIGVLFYAGLSIFQFNFTLFIKEIYQWTPTFISIILTFIGIFDIIKRAILLP